MENPGGIEIPPGLRLSELSLERQAVLIGRKLADILYPGEADDILDRRLEKFNDNHLEGLNYLLSKLEFETNTLGGDGDVLPELARMGAKRDALENLGLFLGYRLGMDKETRQRFVTLENPMTLKEIRRRARIPNMAEANLFIGLGVLVDYIVKDY